ncbi:DgyrCDS8232 [Dimorphilus gyrociliatus]|uniref:gluconokinase n=1 Tax=Dimorphilus gyrociliatus TaxID=2664684 RepID=A0A7I8VYN7_9ANNE|nr:DgyrCDS8232 [Dimorphilus gyrociliatus]
MSRSEALTDEDRLAWLITLRKLILKWPLYDMPKKSYVLACSALKVYYRQILNGQFDNDLKINPLGNTTDRIIFVILNGDQNIIQQRLLNRKGHFMPPSLLQSQFETLELSEKSEPNILLIDVNKSILEIAQEILSHIKNF